jgi:hypothetical protein
MKRWELLDEDCAKKQSLHNLKIPQREVTVSTLSAAVLGGLRDLRPWVSVSTIKTLER